jgi:hypothetical protein
MEKETPIPDEETSRVDPQSGADDTDNFKARLVAGAPPEE